ncbi:hypothetical protein GCM10025738_15600 [Microbacterium fluvii]
MQIALVAADRGGVVRLSELLTCGASRADVRRAVARGGIARVRDGVFAHPTADALVVLAAEHGGRVACVSVLRRLGVWLLDDDDRLHVLLEPKGRRHVHTGCRCVDHRDAGGAGFGIVPIERALVQLQRCVGDESFFAAYESAWRQGRLSAGARAWIREHLPAGKRWLVDVARRNADSGLESILRLRFHRLGVAMRSQVRILDVGRVDFVVDGILILEVDDRQNHDGESLRHRDLMRDARAAAAGYETLRFDYAMVIHDWPTVERAVLARLERARARSRRTA